MSSIDQKQVIDIESLGEDERNMYLAERSKKFGLTIAVCVVYGVIALLLLLLTFFTSWGQSFLYEEMLAFIVTFILGTVIIIIYLANEVYNFKPVQGDSKMGYDAEMCPDYWKLEYVDVDQKDDEGNGYFSDNVNKYHFKYKCVMDPSLIDKEKLKTQNTTLKMNPNKELYKESSGNTADTTIQSLTKSDDKKKFREYAANMTGYEYKDDKIIKKNNTNALKNIDNNYFQNDSSTIPIPCDTVYPIYMSIMDRENKTKNPDDAANKYRCAYAKTCGVPWTDAGCE